MGLRGERAVCRRPEAVLHLLEQQQRGQHVARLGPCRAAMPLLVRPAFTVCKPCTQCTQSRTEAWGHHAGAVGALYGPLHGGANEAVLRMLERIGSVDNIGPFLEGVKNRKEKMFGFGHRSDATSIVMAVPMPFCWLQPKMDACMH